MVKKTKAFVFCLMLFAGLTLAEDDPAVKEFKKASDGGDYRRVYKLGGALLETYPDDDIIRLQYTAAAFVVGEFQSAIGESPFWFPSDSFDCIENMGFSIYAFYMWQNKIAAMAALGNTTGALSELGETEKFEYRPALFVQYLLLTYEGRNTEAEALQEKWFPFPYDGKCEGELSAKRIIPAMKDADNLEQWISSSASYDENMLLLACCGFRDWLDGNKARGLERMERAVREGNPGSAGIPHILYSLCTKKTVALVMQEALDNPLWKKETATLNAYFKAYGSCDWKEVNRQLERFILLSPQDIDRQAIRVFVLLIEGRFREAGSATDAVLKKSPWDTTNVLCLRLYRPIIHRLLNQQAEYKKSIADLNQRELPASWKRTLDIINDPSGFETVTEEFKDQPDNLCMALSIRALIAEVEGDYILAEKLYMRLITEEHFFQYLEFYLADARLKIISPLAALQRINKTLRRK